MISIVSPAAVPGCKLVPIFPTTIYWERQPKRGRERSESYARKFAKSCHLPTEKPGPAVVYCEKLSTRCAKLTLRGAGVVLQACCLL